MELFSQRNKVKNKLLRPDEITDGLKNRIWNEVENKLSRTRERNEIIKDIWSDYFKKSISELHGTTSFH